MSTIELKESIHSVIDTLDERFLRVVHAMLNEYIKEENLSFPGKPMSSEMLKKRVQKAKERVRAGNYITQKELEQEMEEW